MSLIDTHALAAQWQDAFLVPIVVSIVSLCVLLFTYRRITSALRVRWSHIDGTQWQDKSVFDCSLVIEKIRQNIAEAREMGCQVSLIRNLHDRQEVLINVAASSAGTKRILPTSLQVCYSSGKVIESMLIAVAYDRGWIDFDDNICKYWKEFTRNGKKDITIKELMQHRAGLAIVQDAIDFDVVEGFSDPYSDGARNLRTILESLPQRYLNERHANNEPETFYCAVTRGLYSATLLWKADPGARTISQLIKQEILENIESADDMQPVEIYCPPPLEIHDRIVHKHMCYFLPLFVRILFQILLPRWMCHMLIPESRLLSKEEGLILRTVSKPQVLQAYRIFSLNISDETSEKNSNSSLSVVISMLKKCSRLSSELADTVMNILPGRYELTTLIKETNNEIFYLSGNPSTSIISNAYSLAKIGAAFIDRKNQIVRKESLEAALRYTNIAFDNGLGQSHEYTSIGIAHNPFNDQRLNGWYGWYGIDGSCLIFNCDLQLSFSYVPTMFEGRPRRVRSLRLLLACIRALQS